MPLETYIYFLVLGLIMAGFMRNHHDRLNLLKEMANEEQRQRIAFELFTLAKEYFLRHNEWPTRIDQLIRQEEGDRPTPNLNGWKIQALEASGIQTIFNVSLNGLFLRSFAVR